MLIYIKRYEEEKVMNTVFYTKNKDGKPDISNVPYNIVCHARYLDGEVCFLEFYAKRCSDKATLGLCTVEVTPEENSAELCVIELKNHKYANCGIASNLLNVAENFVYQKVGIDYMYLFMAPLFGCGKQAQKLYDNFGYEAKAKNAPSFLSKTLNKTTLKSVLDMSKIETISDNNSNNKQQKDVARQL